MLVQPSRTATVCEVDRARKRAASRKRAQNLGSRANNRWRFITPKTIHLTLTCSCEACSAFTRGAARTLAPSPIRDLLHRRLQPFRYLHDCSGCFRLERLAGWDLHPLESAAFARRTQIPVIRRPLGERAKSNSLLRFLVGPRTKRIRQKRPISVAVLDCAA